MAAVIEPAILAAIHARLDRALAATRHSAAAVHRRRRHGRLRRRRARRTARPLRTGRVRGRRDRVALATRLRVDGRAPPRWPTSHARCARKARCPDGATSCIAIAPTFDAEPALSHRAGRRALFRRPHVRRARQRHRARPAIDVDVARAPQPGEGHRSRHARQPRRRRHQRRSAVATP